ncbi:MAG: NUDIX domain-containing protein [bacterium]|nr:NUDIX domain-containing protein [bacterium]
MSSDGSKYPEVTVGALIFNKEKELLLVKTDKWSGQYCIPGGHIELGETIIDAVRREIKEETNLDIKDIEFHMIEECIFSENFFNPDKHFIFLDYTCTAVTTDVILNEEAQEYEWVDLKDIDKFNIEKLTLKSIHEYIKKQIVDR